ncbi:MAG TPA: biopolymer transporter ExbD [Bacteroidales bacterium]|nr:biopolymer transporter ExbD [Bacteroidales bacterium]
MKIKTKSRVMNNFNMSGMTDIVFLLLIFFMLTSTLIAPNAVKMLMPSPGRTPVQVEQSVPTVTIYGNSRITLDGRNVNVDNLGVLLEAKLTGQSEPTVKVVTSPNVTVEDAVKVMNIAADKDYTVVIKLL